MRNGRVLRILSLAVLTSAVATTAFAGPPAHHPFRFNPALDGKPVYAVDAANGAVWAARAYKSRGEFDIAVSTRDPAGTWSERSIIGRYDGLDEWTPSLVCDASGNVYLAYAVRQTAEIFLATAEAFANGMLSGKVASQELRRIGKSPTVNGIYENPDGTDPLSLLPPGGNANGSGTGTGSGTAGGATGIGANSGK